MDLSRGARLVVAVVAVTAALFSAGLIAEARLMRVGSASEQAFGPPPKQDPGPLTADAAPSRAIGPTDAAPGGPAAATITPPQEVPDQGSGEFTAASGESPPIGSGRVYRYQVVVEQGSQVSAADFAAYVERILSDPRGWTASRRFGFHRVSTGPVDFTVHLATPGTTDLLCDRAGVETGGEVSCRGGSNVVINLKRWQLAVPWYADALEGYRQMVVNHEVGHFLGYGHVACPGAGLPAPVMQQQTLDLQGCVRNPWPYPDRQTFITGPALSR